MDNYCTSCGSPMTNGVCPKCSQVQQQQNSQANMYYQQNYAYQNYNPNMVCATCGTQLVNGVCPRCTNQSMMQTQNRQDSRFNGFFVSKKESLVTTLGNTYIQNYFKTGRVGNGFAVVSNKRVYFYGISYNIFYDAQGRAIANKTSRSQMIDLKDVTGTGFKKICDVGAKAAMIAFPFIYFAITFVLFLLSALMMSAGDGDGFESFFSFMFSVGVIIWIFIALKYFWSRLTLVTIQYAGGELAFNINWFSENEINDFQRKLRLAKDKAIEESENAVANKFTQAVNNMNYVQGGSPSVSPADELMKYAELLQKGLITQEDFDNARRRLI